MVLTQVMASHGVHIVHLTSTFPTVDEMMSLVMFGESIMEKWQRHFLQRL